MTSNQGIRCPWCGDDPLYVDYHDRIWGRPETDDRQLFAKLCLDGQQAGLSWITILRKQPNYEAAFANFDPERIAAFDEARVETLMQDPGIVRNRLKIQSIIRNAQAYLAIQEVGPGFAALLWSFVDGAPTINHWQRFAEVPTETAESRAMSRELKKRGFSFVGPTICYAFMQAVGMVNDHLVDCPVHAECAEEARDFSLGDL
ncbi:DNA-3-methyladenine glycosylase I [Marinobacteraceae bacterium S3BR75-40.1]